MATQAEKIKAEILSLIEEAKGLILERELSLEDFELDGTIDELKSVVEDIKKIDVPEKGNENGNEDEEEKEKEGEKVKPSLGEMLAASRKIAENIRKAEEKKNK